MYYFPMNSRDYQTIKLSFVGIGLLIFALVFLFIRYKRTKPYRTELETYKQGSGLMMSMASLQKVINDEKSKISELKEELEAAQQELQAM